MSDPSRRVFVAFAFSVLALPALAPAAAKSPVVLFVCQAGTAKSAIARELFRRRASERGIDVIAVSRGLMIEDHISAPLRQRLDADALDTRRDGFAALTEADVRKADMVVTFSPLPFGVRTRKLLDWTAVPSVNDAYPVARADLDRRIDALLDAIMAGKRVRR